MHITMAKSRTAKKASKSKKTITKSKKPGLILDTYESWLANQKVKPSVGKSRVQAPLDSYEEWIRRQVEAKARVR